MVNGESWLLDPGTRDYVMDASGKPAIDKTIQMPMFFRIAVPRRGWMYAPDDRYGSDFAANKTKQPATAASLFSNLARQALQPLIDDGRAQEFQTTPSAVPRTGVEIDIVGIDASGTHQQIRGLNPVGLG